MTAALIKQFNNSSESQNNTSAQKSNKVKASTRQLINKFNGNGNKGFGSSTMMKNNNNVNMSKNFSSTPGENRQTSEKSAMSSNVQKMVSAFNQSGFIHNNQ